MLVVGLTGGIGSGKSTVATLFANKGITVIDTDQLARDVVQPGQSALQQISEKFGKDILLPNAQLDRAKLRTLVFDDEEKRRWLEQLLHPLIRAEMKQQIESCTSAYCIVVIPLLFETAPNPLIQRTLVVDVPQNLQISRTASRDQTSTDAVQAILAAQVQREKRLALADDVISNQGTLAELAQRVDQLHEFYLNLPTVESTACKLE